MQQTTAASHQAHLQFENLTHEISLNVSTALADLHSAALRPQSINMSLRYSQQALDNEQERLRSGMGSTINVITLEDRLISALQNDLQAKLAFAQALVQLRLATNTIVVPSSQGGAIDVSVFSTIPVVPSVANESQP